MLGFPYWLGINLLTHLQVNKNGGLTLTWSQFPNTLEAQGSQTFHPSNTNALADKNPRWKVAKLVAGW